MRYRLGAVLGKGGMAEVYDAERVGAEGFTRRVALKRILPSFAGDDRFVHMFLDEARIASQLHHPSIVGVLDYGLLDGLPYQVLELVEGEDLLGLAKLARARAEQLPLEVAVHVCREVAYALHYAHTATGSDGRPLGIVHRDVSPSNILCSWAGDVKLTDFGVAFAHERSQETEVGVAKGKRSYMAPEQLLGERLDGRADIFALGCALHWTFVGRTPIATPDQMAGLMRDGRVQIDPAVPEAIRPIIDRATRGERRERYPDGEAMGDALFDALRQLTDRDGRVLLRDFVARVRPTDSGVRRTYDREVVAAPEVSEASATPTAVRTMVTVSLAQPSEGAAQPDDVEALGTAATVQANPVAARAPDAAQPEGRRRNLPAAVAAAAAAVFLSAGGVWWVTETTQSEPEPSAAVPVIPSGVSPTVPVAADNLPEPGDGADDEPGEHGAHDDSPEQEPTEARPGRSPRPPTMAERMSRMTRPVTDDTAIAPERAVPPSVAERGFLFVGGEGSVNLRVHVDGVDRGRAPRRLELAVGSHRVQLRDPDGAVVATREITLNAENTARRPVRWLRPAQ